MKKITLFLLTILISCSAWGAKIYLRPNSNWNTDNPRFAAYFFGNGEKWLSMTPYYDCYEVDVPSGFTKVIFCRMNPQNTTNNWNNKWNQTGDLTIPTDGKNCFSVPNGSWDGSTTSWGTFELPTLYIAGSMNNWTVNQDKLTYSSDNSSASYTYSLEKGEHQFKITKGSWDWSKGHSDLDTSNSDITSTTNNDGNVKFTLSNQADVKIILSSNQKISVQLYYDVTVTASNGGEVSGGGENIRRNEEIFLTATPYDGYKFVKWNDENTDNPRTITVTSNATYTATFEKLKDVTFFDPSTLTIGETYGKLTYQLSMPSDKWYWISLPFKVDIDKITTSTGNGAKDLVITYYDAKERATTGKGGWKNATEQGLTTLTANQGYVIGFYTDENTLFPANGVTVNFPSASPTNTVAGSANLATTEATGKNEKDNNWHIIGTGLYHQTSTLDSVNYIAVPDNAGDYTYYYVNAPATDIFDTEFTNYTFNPFEAFFVQHCGKYSATAPNAQSAALAPMARAKAQEQEQIYLINMNEAHTVVILNAEGSEGYTAGEDFLEMNASNHSDLIYSFDGSDALAFNHRATEAQSINLGGYVATAGEQTISLNAYNGNVESVTLVDNVTGETADLLAGDYTFNAEVGSLDGRFTVVFGAPKAGDTTVDCYNSTANQLIAYGSANACTVSGLTTGEAVVVYNAMGQLVFATIADSETITLPSLTTGNYLILHNGTTNKVLLK